MSLIHPHHSTSSVKISPFVLAIAVTMAAVGGYVNVSLLEYFSLPVSHMTGTISRLCVDVGSKNAMDFKMISTIVLAFLGGAVFSGTFLGNQKLRPGRRYGILMIIEGVLITAGAFFVTGGNRMALPFVAVACGIQNGMFSSYHSLIIRTTHMTGIVTDLGLLLGHWLRYKTVDYWKIIFLSSLLGGFIFGGLAAALMNNIIGADSLWIAALACFVFGTAYLVWRQKYYPQLID